MKSRLNLFVVMASALMITACSSVPMTSMWKMSKLNPLTMDPGGVSIAVVTHKAVEFSKDSVHIQMAYKTAAAKTSSTKKFPVQINDDALALDGADKKLFSGYQNADEATSTFSLSPQNAQEMKVLQRQITQLKKDKVPGSGNISVSVENICLSDLSLDTVEADIFARFSKKEGYILLVEGVDLLETMAKNGVDKQQFLCR